MANYLHRTTKRYHVSVSGSELAEPLANYIFMPDLSAVTGQPSRHWKITGDIVSLMTQAERDAVDAAILTTSRDTKIARDIDGLENTFRQVVKLILDEINILRAFHGLPARTLTQLKNAIRNGYGT